MGLAPINIFVGEIDIGIECMLSKFATPSCVVQSAWWTERITSRGDIDRLEKLACAYLRKLNKASRNADCAEKRLRAALRRTWGCC